MITVLVLEDEKKVYDLIALALKAQGYSFIDEPQSGGIIKIIILKLAIFLWIFELLSQGRDLLCQLMIL